SWLSSSLNEFQFGAAIRTIELKDNQLDLDTARKLLFSLKQKPDFRTLIVENMPIPEDLQNLVLERYLTPYKQR
ncbi:Leucine Rich Repeat protein, partial [Candida maltosa Xu316]